MEDGLDGIEGTEPCDPEALSELYDRYAPLVYAYVYRRVGDPKVAEDLVGEVFVRVVMAVRAEQTWHTSFRAWLYRVAHNLVVDHYRRRPHERQLPLDESIADLGQDPARHAQKDWIRAQLRHALTCLTPAQQEVLALRYGEGLTARETARIVNKTVGAVEALQRRALAALRRILGRAAYGQNPAPAQASRSRATVAAREARTKA
jgi:RNA polymerase sigma-70 factor (ECF subfamily)